MKAIFAVEMTREEAQAAQAVINRMVERCSQCGCSLCATTLVIIPHVLEALFAEGLDEIKAAIVGTRRWVRDGVRMNRLLPRPQPSFRELMREVLELTKVAEQRLISLSAGRAVPPQKTPVREETKKWNVK